MTLSPLPDLKQHQLPINRLTKDFKKFLDDGYEDPREYLKGWISPRSSIGQTNFQLNLYRAASDRLFGRVRPFAPAWTFEVRCQAQPLRLSLDAIIAMVLIDDGEVSKISWEPLRMALGERLHIYPLAEDLEHPDLPVVILEAATTKLIREHLQL